MKSELKDEWIIGEGKYEGSRLILRQNVGVRPIVGDTRYSFLVGISITFMASQKDGMPTEGEMDLLENVENLIYEYFSVKYRGVICLVLTTQGVREWIIYSSVSDVTELMTTLSQQFPRYHIQHYVDQDKEWEIYKHWDM